MTSYPLCTGTVHAGSITHDGDTCPLHEAPDAHQLYAVLDTIHGPHPVRLSGMLSYGDAVELHEGLYGRTFKSDGYGRAIPASGYTRPVCDPGYAVYGRRVRWFAVRSVTDPNWPSTGPILPLIDTTS